MVEIINTLEQVFKLDSCRLVVITEKGEYEYKLKRNKEASDFIKFY